MRGNCAPRDGRSSTPAASGAGDRHDREGGLRCSAADTGNSASKALRNVGREICGAPRSTNNGQNKNTHGWNPTAPAAHRCAEFDFDLAAPISEKMTAGLVRLRIKRWDAMRARSRQTSRFPKENAALCKAFTLVSAGSAVVE